MNNELFDTLLVGTTFLMLLGVLFVLLLMLL